MLNVYVCGKLNKYHSLNIKKSNTALLGLPGTYIWFTKVTMAYVLLFFFFFFFLKLSSEYMSGLPDIVYIIKI